eukprot:NODE_329_length_9526_cov_0.701708.p2 type:complete len:307 gc:universal NODE_329_length_9526_cov_0.701708:5545-4625(-)
MHNENATTIQSDKELALQRIDNDSVPNTLNSFELKPFKLTNVTQNEMTKSDVNIMNVKVQFTSFQSSAQNAKLKSSKYLKTAQGAKLLNSNLPISPVWNGMSLSENAKKGFYKTPFYNSPTHFQCIHSGAKFVGVQQSGKTSYNVEITINDVQLDKSYVSGYIMIEGITKAVDKLTTFFDGEMIGKHHSFLTRKWQTNEEIDKMHWVKFPSFRTFKYDAVMNHEDFEFDVRQNQDFVYFRFKEHFLVPDHHIQQIPGASFAGFYYICIQLSTQRIQGYYYHSSSQWFQKLDLRYQPAYISHEFEFR